LTAGTGVVAMGEPDGCGVWHGGGVLGVRHARILEQPSGPFTGLLSPLMAVIVLPYLGPCAAAQELNRPAPKTRRAPNDDGHNPTNCPPHRTAGQASPPGLPNCRALTVR